MAGFIYEAALSFKDNCKEFEFGAIVFFIFAGKLFSPLPFISAAFRLLINPPASSVNSTTGFVSPNSLFSLSVSNANESGRKLFFVVSNLFESR